MVSVPPRAPPMRPDIRTAIRITERRVRFQGSSGRFGGWGKSEMAAIGRAGAASQYLDPHNPQPYSTTADHATHPRPRYFLGLSCNGRT
jgi:hypothetical protein